MEINAKMSAEEFLEFMRNWPTTTFHKKKATCARC